MSNAFAQPRPGRAKTTKLAIAGAAALLVIAGGALAYGSFAYDPAPAAIEQPAPSPVSPVGASFSIGIVSGAPLAPVDAPIRLAHAPGLGSASLRFTYDPQVVTLVGVRAGDVQQAALTSHHDKEKGVLVLLLTTSLADGVKGNVDFAVVTLQAKDGGVGAVSDLGLEVLGGVRADGTIAGLEAKDGSFRNGVRGDVLGDGKVDRADYDALASYLVGDRAGIIELNADLDEDGQVTQADAVRLHQYLDGGRETP